MSAAPELSPDIVIQLPMPYPDQCAHGIECKERIHVHFLVLHESGEKLVTFVDLHFLHVFLFAKLPYREANSKYLLPFFLFSTAHFSLFFDFFSFWKYLLSIDKFLLSQEAVHMAYFC